MPQLRSAHLPVHTHTKTSVLPVTCPTRFPGGLCRLRETGFFMVHIAACVRTWARPISIGAAAAAFLTCFVPSATCAAAEVVAKPVGASQTGASSGSGERARITILSTTDLHGHITPVDDFTGKPAQHGLAKVATLVRQARKDNPRALLIDVGDTIQGSPLVYHHTRLGGEHPHPMAIAMNALGYDSMTIGNHEFNFGRAVLDRMRREAAFPLLSANSILRSSGEPAFVPYVIKEVDGVRVAILGLTTPGIPHWENPTTIADLEFRDPLVVAKYWIPRLRGELRADLVVVALHAGLEEDLITGAVSPGTLAAENRALALAREVPGIDVMLLGHTHKEIPALVVNGVLISQAGRWGDRLARADVFLQKARSGAGWSVLAKGARTIPVTAEIEADAGTLERIAAYDRDTQAWLDKTIGEAAVELTAREARERDTALLDLVQRVQLDAGKAEVSLAASFTPSARIPAGRVTVRDIYSLYVYENTLVVIEATGAQLKAALEHAARFYQPAAPGTRPADRINPSVPGYNFDVAEGVTYVLDLKRPLGERVTNLRFRGEPLDPNRTLRLALNSYRHNGGGGFTMFKNAPVLQRDSREIRDLIIEWVEKNRVIPAKPSDNWRLEY